MLFHQKIERMFKTEQADENLQKIVEELELSEIPPAEDTSYREGRMGTVSDESLPGDHEMNTVEQQDGEEMMIDPPLPNISVRRNLAQQLPIVDNNHREEIRQFDFEESSGIPNNLLAQQPRRIAGPTRLQRLRFPEELQIEQPESPTSLRGIAGRSPGLNLNSIIESNMELGD